MGALGFKQFWADRTGHTCHILVSDFTSMLRRLGFGMAEIRHNDPVLDSSSSMILPESAPPDQHHYDEALHGPKPLVRFGRPVYGSIDILIPTRGNTVFLHSAPDPSDTRPVIPHLVVVPSRQNEAALQAELEALRHDGRSALPMPSAVSPGRARCLRSARRWPSWGNRCDTRRRGRQIALHN